LFTRATQVDVDQQSGAVCHISWDGIEVLKQCNNASGVLLVGDFVTRGPHWNMAVHSDQDGGEDTVGRVCTVDTSSGSVSVHWLKTQKEYVYTYNRNGVYEISLILVGCAGKQVTYRHWQGRHTSVPSGCELSSFQCKLCRVQHKAHQLEDTPPFYCPSCHCCICVKCYHTRIPPKFEGIKSRFSLAHSRQMLKDYSPAITDEEVEEALRAAGGEVELAVETMEPSATTPAAIRTTRAQTAGDESLDKLRFLAAVQNGNLDEMKKLKRPEEANACIQGQRTTLHVASGNDQRNVVEYLLSAEVGADTNVIDENGDGPLAYAAQSGNVAIVKLLLENKSDVNLRNKNGLTPLARSVATNRLEVIDVLLASGAVLDNQDSNGLTVVHLAVRNTFPEVLLKLVEKGANVNIKDHNNYTPLHLCSQFKSKRCCEILLEHGADTNIGDESGAIPLHTASALNAVEIMDCILDKDPDSIDAVDSDLRTSLHLACMIVLTSASDTCDSRGEEAALSLIARGASVNVKDSNNVLPIVYAAKTGMPRTVHALIAKDKQCAMEPCGQEGHNAVLAAASKNRFEALQVLLKYSEADLNLGDRRGNTAMHLAALSDGVECSGLLLKHGAALDVCNEQQQTPLHLAAAEGSVKAMELFLKHHPSMTEDVINKQDSYGDTALHDAIACDHESVARLLLTYGADFSIQNKLGRTAVNVSKLKSAKIRALMENEAVTLGAEAASRRQLEGSDIAKRVRVAFPSDGEGKQQCSELEAVLFDNFSCLQDMREYMLEISAEDRTYFCVEVVNSLSVSKIKTKTKVISFLRRLIDELVNTEMFISHLPAIQRQLSFDDNKTPEISWDHLEVDLSRACVVGVGTHGVVIRAKYLFQGKEGHVLDVAVKIMTQTFMSEDEEKEDYQYIRERALKEASIIHRAGISIQSDTVVKLYGVVEGPLPIAWRTALKRSSSDCVIGIVMQYEAGGSLESLLHGKLKREVNMTEKIRILRGIARGLSELHSLPIEYYIVHGDIKPANVLLGAQTPCTVKLADFGISDVKEPLLSTCQVSSLQQTHIRRGTPMYSAPELLPCPNNHGKVGTPSRKSDMYAFAMLAWEVLTRKKPFQEVETEMELCMAVHGGARPDLTELPTHTPPDIVEMIRACLDGDYSKRFSAEKCFMILEHIHLCLCSSHFDIFFSHPWRDKSFLKHVFDILAAAGYRVWYDQLEMKRDMDKSMDEGVKNSSVVVACVNSTYQTRPSCMKELKIAGSIDDPKKPIVCLVTESDPFSWATTDLKELCLFQKNKFCDIGKLAMLGDVAWENPSDEMISDLQIAIQPLFYILDELKIEKSL
jgi:ankyrin repeat protein/serine/threonine protein kinase